MVTRALEARELRQHDCTAPETTSPIQCISYSVHYCDEEMPNSTVVTNPMLVQKYISTLIPCTMLHYDPSLTDMNIPSFCYKICPPKGKLTAAAGLAPSFKDHVTDNIPFALRV